MKTEKRYYLDSYCLEFEAEVTDVKEKGGLFHVALDRSFFYPTSGGQPFDTGTINSIPVVDVYEEEDTIFHVLTQPLTTRKIQGNIDWERRFDHMQQHSGQHLLSAVFEKQLGAATVSFHLGTDNVTIDIDRPSLTLDEAWAVEKEVNDMILRNVPIKAYFVDQEELAALPLRKAPKVTEDIRIVEIDSFDYSPCGGTHPKSTGEIGLLKILGWEKSRNHTRVEFLCGKRALEDYHNKNIAVRTLASALSLKDDELVSGVEKLLEQNKNYTRDIKKMKESLTGYQAEELRSSAEIIGGIRIVKASFSDKEIEELRLLASMITSVPGYVALLGGGNDKNAQLLLSRSEDVTLPMNEIFKQIIPLLEGRGGGNARTAQGGGPKVAELDNALLRALELVNKRLTQ